MEEIREILPEKSEHLLEPAWDFLLASQSNDVLWHGMFGGIYYRFLRQASHKHIITAESLLDRLYGQMKLQQPNIIVQDVLMDGCLDAVLENSEISCFISSLKGGSIFSLNLKTRGYNFLNILKR